MTKPSEQLAVPGERFNEHARAERKRMSIAALAGAQIPLAEIARVSGVHPSSVTWILEQRLPRDEGLQDVYKAFRDEVKPLIRSLLAKAFAQLDAKLSVRTKKTTIPELVKVIREVGQIAGFYGETEAPGPVGKITTKVDTANPEVVKAIMQGLAKEREAKNTTILPPNGED